MKQLIAMLMIFILTLSVLSVPAAAAEAVATEPADTGDLFGVVIVMLLASAMGVAALVTHKTRFEHEENKKAGG